MTSFSTEHYNYPDFTDETREKMDALKIAIEQLENNLIQPNKSLVLNENLAVNYADELNASQLLATTTIAGKVLVIAGAGSGKTKTLTYRTSYLIEQGVNPKSILLLTFTRKASNEIKNRAKKLLADKFSSGNEDEYSGGKNINIGDITSGTFHSFCNMLLRRYSKILDINSKFTILHTGDSEDAIDMVVKENKFGKIGAQSFPRKKTIQKIISACRNRQLSIAAYVNKNYADLSVYENLALDPPNDSVAVQDSQQESDNNVVTISTIHSAKGLEWSVVYVNSLIDGTTPHYKSSNDFEEMEEECKLFYVACSRAKNNLYLTAPNYFASYSGYFDKISRFVVEVPSSCLLTEDLRQDKLKYAVYESESDEDWW